MKIVFLDVDGVLNCHSTYDSIVMGNNCYRISRELLNNYLSLQATTKCKTVLSSTWRMSADAVKFLKGVGIDIIDCTVVRADANRSKEIAFWMETNAEKYGVTDYAIIDDDSGYTDEQKKHFYHTTPESGFTSTIAYRIAWQFLMLHGSNKFDMKMKSPRKTRKDKVIDMNGASFRSFCEPYEIFDNYVFPLYVMNIDLNADGNGPETDPTKVVKTEYEVWDQGCATVLKGENHAVLCFVTSLLNGQYHEMARKEKS